MLTWHLMLKRRYNSVRRNERLLCSCDTLMDENLTWDSSRGSTWTETKHTFRKNHVLESTSFNFFSLYFNNGYDVCPSLFCLFYSFAMVKFIRSSKCFHLFFILLKYHLNLKTKTAVHLSKRRFQ